MSFFIDDEMKETIEKDSQILDISFVNYNYFRDVYSKSFEYNDPTIRNIINLNEYVSKNDEYKSDTENYSRRSM